MIIWNNKMNIVRVELLIQKNNLNRKPNKFGKNQENQRT